MTSQSEWLRLLPLVMGTPWPDNSCTFATLSDRTCSSISLYICIQEHSAWRILVLSRNRDMRLGWIARSVVSPLVVWFTADVHGLGINAQVLTNSISRRCLNIQNGSERRNEEGYSARGQGWDGWLVYPPSLKHSYMKTVQVRTLCSMHVRLSSYCMFHGSTSNSAIFFHNDAATLSISLLNNKALRYKRIQFFRINRNHLKHNTKIFSKSSCHFISLVWVAVTYFFV